MFMGIWADHAFIYQLAYVLDSSTWEPVVYVGREGVST